MHIYNDTVLVFKRSIAIPVNIFNKKTVSIILNQLNYSKEIL
jgi:hypothetical protein